jgi:transcriptional regulator with XRE-family HTH domain
MADLDGQLAVAIREVFEELLERRGWTLARLASVTGVSRMTVNRWHNGSVDDPRYLGLAKLFYLAERSLDLLPPSDAVSSPAGTRTPQALILPERGQRAVGRSFTAEPARPEASARPAPKSKRTTAPAAARKGKRTG